MFHMPDEDVTNELIVTGGMNHVYPLYPIEEARSACNKVFHIVMRQRDRDRSGISGYDSAKVH